MNGCPFCGKEAGHRPHRIDPAGCGCTDCLLGWTRPADEAILEDRIGALLGDIRDASGGDLRVPAEMKRAMVAALRSARAEIDSALKSPGGYYGGGDRELGRDEGRESSRDDIDDVISRIAG